MSDTDPADESEDATGGHGREPLRRPGDGVGEERVLAADRRDQDADVRDDDADQRDNAADERDHAADERDLAADERDKAADQAEEQIGDWTAADALSRSAVVRHEAASDRRRASQDRTASTGERTRAEDDRTAALADRSASGRERDIASVDDLTGAYLRGAGFVELAREIARAKRTGDPLVLAFVDVDRLKAINDSRGHAAGDQVLLEVANTFRAKLRAYDLIIRYGGDEFVCVISGLNIADATARLALVNATLAEAPGHGSVTVGLAELRPDDSPEDLVARADAALYRERQQG